MKVSESGMPEETIWGGFFEPEKVLGILHIDKNIQDVADFGCGYGTFTIPAAKIVSGRIYAIDIESEMIRSTQKRNKRGRKFK